MYYSWKKNRIITKLAVWATREGEASQFIYTLADAVTERVANGELEGPDEWESVGIRRNAEPVEIDEEDRRLWMYFCHPAGETGEFEGHPVDYKLLAPGAPVEGNRAYRSSVRDADGILWLAASGEDADAQNGRALTALAKFADPEDVDAPPEAAFADPQAPPFHILLPPAGTDRPDPEVFRRRHNIPDRVRVRPAEPWKGDVAWREFLKLADALRPRLERAADDDRIPRG
ncbi:MAG: hypothetical protein ABEN55_08595 [Bradymonadaceae bacterium]